jgi:hypothetical protein
VPELQKVGTKTAAVLASTMYLTSRRHRTGQGLEEQNPFIDLVRVEERRRYAKECAFMQCW